MRNITHTQTSSIDGLKLAGKGLNKDVKDRQGNKIPNPKFVAYHHYLSQLETVYREYDAHTNPCKLEELSPLLPIKPDDSEEQRATKAYYRDGLHELYGRERSFIKSLWDEVAIRNGKLIMCPYCGYKIVEDLDHYIPRAEMPEYSVHLLNLIPLCHKCNKDKHDNWVGGSADSMFFNAYFDRLPDIKAFLHVTISFTSTIPNVNFSFDKTAASLSGVTGKKVANTVEHLHLVKLYWQPKAEETLRDEVRQILAHCRSDKKRHPDMTVAELWSVERDCIVEIQSELEDFEFVKHKVYQAIIDSTGIESWLSNEL